MQSSYESDQDPKKSLYVCKVLYREWGVLNTHHPPSIILRACCQ